MGVFKPPAPSEILKFQNNYLTITDPIETLILHSGDEDIFPSFNEYTINRCSLNETPCGGMKNSITPDMRPGTVSIVGDYCYLKTIAETAMNKTISAGKLAENKEINTSDESGISYCTADGIEYLTIDTNPYTIIPSKMIVVEFQVINISDNSQTCTINIRCPDSVSSLSLYNLETFQYESVSFTNVVQTYGTINSYSFNRTIPARTTHKLQVMISYNNLVHTFKFSNDANKSYGIHNLDTWIAYYNINSDEMNFITFNKVPEEIICVQNDLGVITSLRVKCNNCIAKRGKITYANTNTNIKQSTQFVDCLNPEMPGSLTKFLNSKKAVNENVTASLTTYVVPAISDTKILPTTAISSDYISNEISIKSCPNEYTCASFVIKPDKDVKVNIKISDLVNGSNIIPKENINARYVERWYQAGYDVKNTHRFGHFYTPELLVKDPTLVKTTCDEWEYYNIPNNLARNKLKLNTGAYIDITSTIPTTRGYYKPTVTERPIYDSEYLHPINLTKNINQQVWITTHINNNAVAGIYTGNIIIEIDGIVLKTINISIEVLPIILLPSSKTHSIYYRSRLMTTGTISSEDKNTTQYTAELVNMANHGITCPTCYQVPADSLLPNVLALRQQYFPTCTELYMFGRTIKNATASDISRLITVGATYGIDKVYIYGIDESNMNTTETRALIQAVHDNSAYVFCAQNAIYALAVKDVLDLAIGSSAFTAADITEFKTSGHKIYSYGNPQTVIEYPLTFRRNYGLYLWQMGYDGAMPYAYQHGMQDVYSDFDDEMYRDHCMTYPTANGVIDTIQWEGFREGINDLKYLATLEALVTEAKSQSIDTSNIDTWLNNLKTVDLTTVDLYAIREQMIDYIINLQITIE